VDFWRENKMDLIIPSADVYKIEKARKDLWELVEAMEKKTFDSDHLNVFVANITQPMWELTHRRYKETFISKIKRLLAKKSK